VKLHYSAAVEAELQTKDSLRRTSFSSHLQFNLYFRFDDCQSVDARIYFCNIFLTLFNIHWKVKIYGNRLL